MLSLAIDICFLPGPSFLHSSALVTLAIASLLVISISSHYNISACSYLTRMLSLAHTA